ncbi:hypothetical protein [Sulfurivirga sp.]|uniref:hypothetical protein n=1 Tax=Sulfurivirga sp. TaxID=2614236 RepID=UPI0025CC1DBC|nr:hypothetical protein [Sulfurivirga sp.]
MKTMLSVALATLVLSGMARAEDARTPIVLGNDERAMVLKEMREFLDALRKMNAALAEENFAAAAQAARKVGRAAQQQVPPGLKKKLPRDFMQLGGATHAAFDRWAMDAETMEDVSLSLKQMGRLMNNCVACHARYRIEGPHRD